MLGAKLLNSGVIALTFEFALRVGGINECRKIIVGADFFRKFSRKLVIFGTIWTHVKNFSSRYKGGGGLNQSRGACTPPSCEPDLKP